MSYPRYPKDGRFTYYRVFGDFIYKIARRNYVTTVTRLAANDRAISIEVSFMDHLPSNQILKNGRALSRNEFDTAVHRLRDRLMKSLNLI